MGEAACGAQEAGWDESELLCLGGIGRLGLALEALADDVLDAADVDQVEAGGAPAGAVDPVGSVPVHQSQQLLRLA